MKKAFKILGFIFLIGVIGFFAFYLIKNESLPEAKPSIEADQLAEAMMASLNKAAWDTTWTVSWTSRSGVDYIWDRREHLVNLKWRGKEVDLDPNTISGTAKRDGELLEGEEAQKLIKRAWDFFNNDSFWLAAPFKAFDPGTERSIITCKDGRKGLKVTYTSGGTTPGDSYVWILNENNRPTSIKMWVSILPIGGLEFTWENYLTLSSGAMLAQDHYVFGLLNAALVKIH